MDAAIRRVSAPTFSVFARVLRSEPTDPDLWRARDPQVIRELPLAGAEAERGAALVIESGLAREPLAKVRADYARVLDPMAPGAPLARAALPVAPAILAADFGALGFADAGPADHLGAILGAINFAADQGRADLAARWLERWARPWAPAACAEAALRCASLFYQGVLTLTGALLEDRAPAVSALTS